METLIQISFDSSEQQELFANWFRNYGFDIFISTKENEESCEQMTCLSTDEKMEWGTYFELQ